jgi:hypothetical protein
VYLDNDIPNKILNSYAIFDELYYTIPGFNLFHYGQVNPTIIANVSVENNAPTNIAQNLATYLSLKAFGNNFYGLRMGSVFCAVLIFILFYLLLRKVLTLNHTFLCSISTTTTKLLLFIPMLYLLLDFSFLAAGRVAEPTIYRMLALVIMLYIGSFIDFSHIKPWQSFLLGFLAFAAVSFVYVYNAFMYAAFGLTVFVEAFGNGWKNAVKHSVLFVGGTLLCLLFYQVFVSSSYNSSLLEVYRNLIPFQSRVAGTTGIDAYMTNVTLVWMTNIFRFNVTMLFIFLVSIPVFIDKIKKFRSDFDTLIICLIGFLFLQSIFINDYALRKLLVLLPLILIMALLSYLHAPAYFRELTRPQRNVIKFYWVLIWVISLLVLFCYLKSNLIGDLILVSDYFTALNFVVFLFGATMLSLYYPYAFNVKKTVWGILIISLLVPNAFLDFRYVFLNRSTVYRDTMISLADKVDGQYVVGGLDYAFRLYNTSIPILNFYTTKYGASPESADKYHKYFDQLFNDGTGSYSIAVIQDQPEEEVVNIDYMERHGLKLEEEYDMKDLINVNIGLFSPEPVPSQY